MNAKFLLGATAALMLTACSQDEVTSFKQDGIDYSVVTGKQLRAVDSYCQNNLPDAFHVWARTTGADASTYINGDKIVKTGSDPVTWADENGTHYWPESKTLDFFAEVNGTDQFSLNDGAPTFNDFEVKDDVAQQLDLMYAVKKGLTKADGTVNLNFRHALSQVCFKAKNDTRNLNVEIKGVSVGHLTAKGTFAFPTESTDKQYINHTDETGSVEPGLNSGTWSYPADAAYDKQYDVALTSPVTLAPNSESNLTCPGDNHKNGWEKVLTLLPQQVQKWTPTTSPYTGDGAYFLVDLVLTNITKGDSGEDILTVAYEGKAAIPVEINWQPGYRYIYTFIFDEGGNGGWTDGETPQPVLSNIKYDVTVDDFVSAGDDEHMDTGDQPAYKHNAIINLHNGTTVQPITVKTNDDTFDFVLASKYTPEAEEEKTFLGWSKNPSATTAEYAEGDVMTIDFSESAIDLYAIWADKKYPFEIVFELNGGIDGDGINTFYQKRTINRVNGFKFTFPTTAPTKEGYTFKGWATEQNGEVKYNLGSVLALDKNNRNMTFYAVWEKKNNDFKLVFDGVREEAQNVPAALTYSGSEESHEFTVPDADNMTCGNYEFKGWADTKKVESVSDIKYKAGSKITVTKDSPNKTIYAVWGTPTGVIVPPVSPGQDWNTGN